MASISRACFNLLLYPFWRRFFSFSPAGLPFGISLAQSFPSGFSPCGFYLKLSSRLLSFASLSRYISALRRWPAVTNWSQSYIAIGLCGKFSGDGLWLPVFTLSPRPSCRFVPARLGLTAARAWFLLTFDCLQPAQRHLFLRYPPVRWSVLVLTYTNLPGSTGL